MYGSSKERILEFVTDPAKRDVVEKLSEEVLASLVAYSCTTEQADMWRNDPDLFNIRVIFFRQLADWGSVRAEKMYAEYSEFVSDPTFVQYPEFLTDPAITKATRLELLNPHPSRIESFYDLDIEIIGARVVDGFVQVLLSHNPVIPMNDGISDYSAISHKDHSIPPAIKKGYLKRNPTGELYIDTTGFYGERYLEIVIPSTPQPEL